MNFKPDLVDDVNARLLKKYVLDEASRYRHLPSPCFDQLLTQVGFPHHVRAETLRRVHHRLQKALEEKFEQECLSSEGKILWNINTLTAERSFPLHKEE